MHLIYIPQGFILCYLDLLQKMDTNEREIKLQTLGKRGFDRSLHINDKKIM